MILSTTLLPRSHYRLKWTLRQYSPVGTRSHYKPELSIKGQNKRGQETKRGTKTPHKRGKDNTTLSENTDKKNQEDLSSSFQVVESLVHQTQHHITTMKLSSLQSLSTLLLLLLPLCASRPLGQEPGARRIKRSHRLPGQEEQEIRRNLAVLKTHLNTYVSENFPKVSEQERRMVLRHLVRKMKSQIQEDLLRSSRRKGDIMARMLR